MHFCSSSYVHCIFVYFLYFHIRCSKFFVPVSPVGGLLAVVVAAAQTLLCRMSVTWCPFPPVPRCKMASARPRKPRRSEDGRSDRAGQGRAPGAVSPCRPARRLDNIILEPHCLAPSHPARPGPALSAPRAGRGVATPVTPAPPIMKMHANGVEAGAAGAGRCTSDG